MNKRAKSSSFLQKRNIFLQHYATTFLFIHEVSHIFGCAHDLHQLRGRGKTPPYPWGVGSFLEGTNKRTLLAYRRDGFEKKIGYLSGPGVRDQAGDETGGEEENNVR